MRKSKRLISSLFVAAMLFAQFTIAAHACPVMSPSSGNAGLAVALDSLPAADLTLDANAAAADAAPCSQMSPSDDTGTSMLCAEHCSYGEQSGQSQTLTVPALAMTSLYLVQSPPDAPLPALRAAASTDSRLAASPPHSILHCCLLI